MGRVVMTYAIQSLAPGRPTGYIVHSTYETYDQALRVARDIFDILELEEDKDYIAADFVTKRLDVYCIQAISGPERR